ncbi:uncharacterized protein RHO17_004849 [Thomomys bottae]
MSNCVDTYTQRGKLSQSWPALNICVESDTQRGNVSQSWPALNICEHHTLEVLISEPSANVCDVTTFPATAVCDSNIDICTDGKDPTEVGTEELTKSEDNDLTMVVFHSNEENSNCTSAFEFCSAHDDDSVTERDDTTLTAIADCDSRINIWDTSSYTTTKLDETNNNEGDSTTLTAIAVCDPTINICLDKNDSTEFGTEEFKQSEDSSLTKVVVHSDEEIKRGWVD